MRRFILTPGLLLSFVLTAIAADDATQTPEDAFRRLMLGMVKDNPDEIKAAMLPADDADVLWQGSAPPKEIQDQIEKSIRDAKFTRVKEGEKIQFPDNKEMVIDKSMIGDKKVLLWVEMDGQRMPFPFWIEQKEDGWKVDARPLIAARKAAKAMQQGNK